MAIRGAAWLACFGAFYLFVSAGNGAYIDDAMITATYARNLAAAGRFAALSYTEHYGFTSIANVVMQAIAGLLTSFEQAIPVATAAQLTALTAASLRLSRVAFGSARPGVALAAMLALNPLLLSTFGLESTLVAALLVALFGAALAERWLELGCILGALVLARPDMLVVAVAAFLTYCRPGRRLRMVPGFVLPVLAWHAFAWVRFGTALPATFFIKRGQRSWDEWDFWSGPLLYAQRFPVEVAAATALLAAALLLPLLPKSPGRALAAQALAWACGFYLAFAALGVPPYHWYYVPPLTLGLIAAWSAAVAYRRALPWALAAAALIGLVAAGGLGRNEVPIHTNWATHDEYREMGRALQARLPRGTKVEMRGEIGTLLFYSELDLVDAFSSPIWLEPLAAEARDAPAGLRAALLRANFAFFEPLAARPAPAWLLEGRWDRSFPASPELAWTTGSRWVQPVGWQLEKIKL